MFVFAQISARTAFLNFKVVATKVKFLVYQFQFNIKVHNELNGFSSDIFHIPIH